MGLNGKIRGYLTIAEVKNDGTLFIRIDGDLKDFEGDKNLIEMNNLEIKVSKNGGSKQVNHIRNHIFIAVDKELQLKSENKEFISCLPYFINRHCEFSLEINAASIEINGAKKEISIPSERLENNINITSIGAID